MRETYCYCRVHGWVFNLIEEGGCPSCKSEWEELDEDDPRHPYDEEYG